LPKNDIIQSSGSPWRSPVPVGCQEHAPTGLVKIADIDSIGPIDIIRRIDG
jgi:hypothetical protein